MADHRHRKARELLEEHGYEFVGFTGKQHLKFRHRTRGDVITASSSPSDGNWLKAMSREIQRRERSAMVPA